MNRQNGTEANSHRKKAKHLMQSSWKGHETRSDDASKNWRASKTSLETSDWHASKLMRPVWPPTFEIVLDVRTRQKLTRINNWRVACVATPLRNCFVLRFANIFLQAHQFCTLIPPARKKLRTKLTSCEVRCLRPQPPVLLGCLSEPSAMQTHKCVNVTCEVWTTPFRYGFIRVKTCQFL